jgi:hypothetical protein
MPQLLTFSWVIWIIGGGRTPNSSILLNLAESDDTYSINTWDGTNSIEIHRIFEKNRLRHRIID